jgi:3-oxoacyl-[acyl-carrier protein] reductase
LVPTANAQRKINETLKTQGKESVQTGSIRAVGATSLDMFSLQSKVALVTGSGRGIGRAIAEHLSAAGARVMLNDLDSGPLDQARQAISGSAYLAGDLTDPAFPERLVQRTISQLGGLDIIINNAGYTWDNTIQKTSDEQFQAMLDIHTVAPFRILRAAAPFIRENAKREAAEGRRIHRKVVNITSISATDGSAGQAGYSSGKAAVIGLTRTLAKEWGRYNVNVNAVGFGLIDTRLTQPLTPESTIEVKGREIRIGVQPGVLDKVIAASPLGRAGSAAEAAGAVLFFCSPLSDFVTGEVLMCSGGMHF